MSDLTSQFENAVTGSKSLAERPDNATMLKLYALYKQASTGDASDDQPGATDFVARAKWDAWNEFRGVNQDDAKQRYIDLVEDLKA